MRHQLLLTSGVLNPTQLFKALIPTLTKLGYSALLSRLGAKTAGYGELIPQLIDELIAIPRGLKLIVRGLEKIYRDGGDEGTTRSELKEFVDAAKKALERQPTAATQLAPAELRIFAISTPRRS